MKQINTSNSTFANFREGELLYVDKTAILHQWVRLYQGQYFLARPRRFGKSLMISTLRSIFEGRRELFKGLAIDQLDYDWKVFPVIHLNMGSTVGENKIALQKSILFLLKDSAEDWDIELDTEDVNQAFQQLIKKLYQKLGSVVILIDEYDKPLLSHLGKPSAADIQEVLKNFYGVIKTTESKQRFTMITGVSKFSKVSIFSDLNNLTDLSMQRDSATLLGYTQDELEGNFAEYIEGLALAQKTSSDETLKQLKTWYNGYCFHSEEATVYNPVSVMKCFAQKEFQNYWFETGTPTFLIDLLKSQPIELGVDLKVPASAFSAYEPLQLQVLPLLIQTGYLTIRGCDLFGDEIIYELGYPNREVDHSFNRMLTKGLGNIDELELSQSLRAMVNSLNMGHIDDLLNHLKIFFAGIPYDIQLSNEKYYQSLFFVIFRMLNTVVEAETRSSSGRVDALLKTPERIVIFEFKLFGTAEDAMEQIKSKEYSLAYRDDGRLIQRVGVAFDAETRNLGRWLVE